MGPSARRLGESCRPTVGPAGGRVGLLGEGEGRSGEGQPGARSPHCGRRERLAAGSGGSGTCSSIHISLPANSCYPVQLIVAADQAPMTPLLWAMKWKCVRGWVGRAGRCCGSCTGGPGPSPCTLHTLSDTMTCTPLLLAPPPPPTKLSLGLLSSPLPPKAAETPRCSEGSCDLHSGGGLAWPDLDRGASEETLPCVPASLQCPGHGPGPLAGWGKVGDVFYPCLPWAISQL